MVHYGRHDKQTNREVIKRAWNLQDTTYPFGDNANLRTLVVEQKLEMGEQRIGCLRTVQFTTLTKSNTLKVPAL